MVKQASLKTTLLAASLVVCITLPLAASGGAFRAYPGKVVFVRSGQIFAGNNADLTGAINIATGSNPSVSPDGTTVAYDSGGQVRTVSITGTGDAPLAGAAGSQP